MLGRTFGTGEREVERYVTGIVCLEEIVLGGLDKRWEGKGVGELCVESRLCYRDWIEGGKGRERGNCVLRADCVRGLDNGREGSGGIV